MSLFKKTYYYGTSILPIELLKKISSGNVLLPYHHLVSDEKVKHVCHLYPYKGVTEFIADLDYLLTNFRPINPYEIIKSIRNKEPLPSGGFLLSFDDGLREVYDVVADILHKKGVPALFFLNPSFLNNKEMFYRNKLSIVIDKLVKSSTSDATIRRIQNILEIDESGLQEIKTAILNINYLNRALADKLGECLDISFESYLAKEKPYLTCSQVEDLIKRGFYIGSHSMDHPNYRLISGEEQIRQTIDSCKYVKDTFNLSYSIFSFPHEDADLKQSLFDALLDNPEISIDILFGTQNQKMELNNKVLHRFNAERSMVPFSTLVKGMLFYNMLNNTWHKSVSRS